MLHWTEAGPIGQAIVGYDEPAVVREAGVLATAAAIDAVVPPIAVNVPDRQEVVLPLDSSVAHHVVVGIVRRRTGLQVCGHLAVEHLRDVLERQLSRFPRERR